MLFILLYAQDVILVMWGVLIYIWCNTILQQLPLQLQYYLYLLLIVVNIYKQFAMVKGGTNFRKHAGQRRKKRKCPMRAPLSADIDMISETEVDLSGTSDGEMPVPSNVEIPASEKKLTGWSN